MAASAGHAGVDGGPAPRDLGRMQTAVTDPVAAAQRGEPGAFDRLYDAHAGRVYALCLRMTGDAVEAEGLTQDVFVRLWRGIGTFRGESAFTSWLHRLTVNVVLEARRSWKRRVARVEPVDDPGALAEGAVGPDDAAGRIDLERAIALLPAGARLTLVLHDLEGYTHEEIGRMTGTTAGTSKAQLHRARKLLREHYLR
jgi:RNA polymerase sigma-70 factor (ECF subfamily)